MGIPAHDKLILKLFWAGMPTRQDTKIEQWEKEMLLTDLHKGDHGEIVKILSDKALRDRFSSFGIMPGETFEILACSIAKQTMKIKIGSTSVALRAEEAEKIEVTKIDS